MGSLIQFPRRNVKVKVVKNLTSHVSIPFYLVLAMIGLFVFSIVFNLSFKSKTAKSRDLANYGSLPSTKNLDDYILKSLNSSDGSVEVIYSKKPTYEDKFVFETLLGNYDIFKEKGKIVSIELKSGRKSLALEALPQVLEHYGIASGLKVLSYKLKESVGSSGLKYTLLQNNLEIGEMFILLSDNNELVSVKAVYK